MKCPKCHYLGFDTGDRCRNCGYDFSLVATPSIPADVDVPLRPAARSGDVDRVGDVLLARDADTSPYTATPHPMTPAAITPPPVTPTAVTPTPVTPVPLPTRAAGRGTPARTEALPLFTETMADDEPLVKLPTVPRAPLAVRRTPDAPRMRPALVVRRREDQEPSLDLKPDTMPARARRVEPRAEAMAAVDPCSAGARIGAALIDLTLLVAIDVLVVYFTLRMAALRLDEWPMLPPVPLVVFLLLVKGAYYWAFTAIGGQTIGKMAMRIRVVSEEGPVVAPARAFRRTVAAAASVMTLGATFLPAFVGSDRRTVHDRMARTRVVTLPAA